MATKIVDRGWDSIKRELKFLNNLEIVVGTFGDVEYAGYVEFGTYKMAARPYIRNTFEREGDAMQSAIQASYSTVLSGGSALAEARRLGARYEGHIKRTFRMFGDPPIDTGRLRQSITYEIN